MGIIDLSLLAVGSALFLAAFITWLTNLRRGGELITSGVYRVVRHPQYLGIILLALGVTLRSLRPASLIAWVTLLVGYLILASLEERYLYGVYGGRYEEYSKRAAFILPCLKISFPPWLSPRKPYRYVIFGLMWLLSTITIVVGMRGAVFALRSIHPFIYGLH